MDARKLDILASVVERYILTGEPVGSKLISQLLSVRLSSATIRNEMAEMFDMGLLEQPHASAGRIPSHLGYRLYIDRLISMKPLSKAQSDEIDALFNIADPDPDKLLRDTARSLADYTKCAVVSTTLTPKNVSVKRIDIIPVTERTALIVMIASNGVIKNKACRTDFKVTPEICEFIGKFVNGRLGKVSLSAISARYIKSVMVSLDEYSEMFTPLLLTIYELCSEINDGQFFIGGLTNLLGYSELFRTSNLLLPFIARQDEIRRIVGEAEDITVIFGRENAWVELSDTAIVVKKFNIGNFNKGAIAVIGPMRLDYAKLIPHLEYFAEKLSGLLADAFHPDVDVV